MGTAKWRGKEEGEEEKTYFAQLGPLEWKAARTLGNKSCAMIFKREGIIAQISFMYFSSM